MASFNRSIAHCAQAPPKAIYSTYLGGSSLAGFPGDLANAIALDRHTVNGIAVDSRGDAYVAGITTSGDFPVTRDCEAASIAPAMAPAWITPEASRTHHRMGPPAAAIDPTTPLRNRVRDAMIAGSR